MPKTDNALEEAAQRGNRQAFSRIILREAPRQLRVAQRMLGSESAAEDAVQEAFAAAWLAIGRYDPTRPFPAWMTRITLNKCRDIMRRDRVRRLFWLPAEDSTVPVSASPDPEEVVGDRRQLKIVEEAVARLPAKLKEPLILTAIEGHSYAGAAEILGVSRKTLEMRIYRARQRLREAMEKYS